MPVWMRGCGGLSPRRPTRREALPFGRLAPLAPETGAEVFSSIIVFHSPQLSQRPDHLEAVLPQDWQTKLDADLAMGRI
jgi:hypothetical protein